MRIVGYTYRADNYCPTCIISEMVQHDALPAHYLILNEDAETLLDAGAAVHNIERGNEASFDSGDYPKVIFPGMTDDQCGRCGTTL